MDKNNTSLIISDIEGCIMSANRSPVALEKLTLITDYCKTAQDDSELPRLVFCTGRSAPFVEAIIQVINGFFPKFPSIVENGACLFDITKNEVIKHPLLTVDVLKAMREVQNQVENFTGKGKAKKEYGKEICISLNPVTDKSIKQLFGETQKYLADWSEIIEITHSESAVDITPKGINKAAGVEFLAQYTSIKLEHMLAIGDARGDLPMLDLVGIPTCPQNAAQEVKKIVKYVATQAETDGVVEILRRFTSWR